MNHQEVVVMLMNLFPWDETDGSQQMLPFVMRMELTITQNITYDHSYYSNYTLFDGYFLTGMGEEDITTIPSDLEPGEKFRPFRNPRLVPYIHDDWVENRKWKLTEYDQKISNKVGNQKNEELRYQTLAADLLLEGSIINSTSVNSWIAHLIALKGLKSQARVYHPMRLRSPVFLKK